MPRGSKSGSWSAKRSASKRFASGKVGRFSTKGARAFARSERRGGHALVASVTRQPQIDESTRELLADLADHLYPGIEHVDELPRKERASWGLIYASVAQSGPEKKESIRRLLEGADVIEFQGVTDIIGPPVREVRGIEEEVAEAEERIRQESAGPLLPAPPPSPTYDRLFGNQIRWAIHVIRYNLQQRRLKSSIPETK